MVGTLWLKQSSGRTCFLGFIVNVNILKKGAAGMFRSLKITIRIHRDILHTPIDRSFSRSRYCYEGIA